MLGGPFQERKADYRAAVRGKPNFNTKYLLLINFTTARGSVNTFPYPVRPLYGMETTHLSNVYLSATNYWFDPMFAMLDRDAYTLRVCLWKCGSFKYLMMLQGGGRYEKVFDKQGGGRNGRGTDATCATMK